MAWFRCKFLNSQPTPTGDISYTVEVGNNQTYATIKKYIGQTLVDTFVVNSSQIDGNRPYYKVEGGKLSIRYQASTAWRFYANANYVKYNGTNYSPWTVILSVSPSAALQTYGPFIIVDE